MKKKLAIGIDIGNEITQVSYLIEGMYEPETVGGLLPTQLKKNEDKTWCIEEEAIKQAGEFLLACFEHIPELKNLEMIDSLCIVCTQIDKVWIQRMKEYLLSVGIKEEQICFEGQEEAAIYFALSQDRSLWQQEVVFFDLSKEGFSYRSIKLQRAGRRTKIFMDEKDCSSVLNISMLETEEGKKKADADFHTLLQSLFGVRIISAVYLIGQGFCNEDWAINSLRYVCSKRRAFKGLNLYTKGACYKAYDKIQNKALEDFLLICPGRLSVSIGIKIIQGESEYVLYLAQAGKKWYEETKEIECIVDNKEEAEFVIVPIDGREEWKENVSLEALPHRENKMTRIKIGVEFFERNHAEIILSDLGFGKFAAESGIKIKKEIFLESEETIQDGNEGE